MHFQKLLVLVCKRRNYGLILFFSGLLTGVTSGLIQQINSSGQGSGNTLRVNSQVTLWYDCSETGRLFSRGRLCASRKRMVVSLSGCPLEAPCRRCESLVRCVDATSVSLGNFGRSADLGTVWSVGTSFSNLGKRMLASQVSGFDCPLW